MHMSYYISYALANFSQQIYCYDICDNRHMTENQYFMRKMENKYAYYFTFHEEDNFSCEALIFSVMFRYRNGFSVNN